MSKKSRLKYLSLTVATILLTGVLLSGCGAADSQGETNSMSENQETIGIIGAMEEEVDSLKQATDIDSKEEISSMEFCKGTIGDTNVIIVQCGMGKVNAGICASILINEFGCTKVINTGVAGSLDNTMNIGDIVISTDAVQHDFDVEPIGFTKGEIPYTGLCAFPADEKLRKLAVEATQAVANDITYYEGRVCSGDQFISTREQKEKIISEFGGLCCEMEGGAVAQTCYLNDTPFVIIRAISDKSDGSQSVEYEEFKAEAAKHCADIVLHMIKSL